MNKKKYVLTGTMLVLTFALIASSPSLVSASTGAANYKQGQAISRLHAKFQMPTIGKVVNLNGNLITLTGKNGTTYTVDATNSKIMKNGATATVASILNGDSLAVQGTVSGTNITATAIRDGQPAKSRINKPETKKNLHLNFGTVTAINGTSFSLTKKTKTATTTLTVNTTSSTVFKKNGQAAKLADLAVGQRVTINGTLNASTNTIDPVTKVSILTSHPIVKKSVHKTIVKKVVKKVTKK